MDLRRNRRSTPQARSLAKVPCGLICTPALRNFHHKANQGLQVLPSDAMRIRAGRTVRAMEKELIFRTLADVNDNRTQAAELLGISIRTLRNKLREYREEGESSKRIAES